MPFPLLLLLLVLAGGVFGGAGTAFVVVLSWPKIRQMLWGKKVIIMGRQQVGKSNLAEFLRSGTLPETYEPTVQNKKSSAILIKMEDLGMKDLSMKDLSLDVKSVLDTQGGLNPLDLKEHMIKSDIIFYLVRADEFMNGDCDAYNAAQNSFEHIRTALDIESKANHPQIFLIGTHLDRVTQLGAVSGPDSAKNALEHFRSMEPVKQLVRLGGGKNQVTVFLADTSTKEGVRALVLSFILQITKSKP